MLLITASMWQRAESSAARRGGRDLRVPLDPEPPAVSASPAASEVLRIHEALEQLATISDRLVRIVEMRYFAGMTEGEIGEALGLTERTVRRDWEKAKLVLAAVL